MQDNNSVFGVHSSYPMWAIVPCVLVGYGRVEWQESFAGRV